MTDDDKLLVLPLGEESKLITQTIANDTARQILELLADGAMSTSSIAKKLDIPLTTAQYNVEKLIEAKLVVVEKTKYSEKGREVKLYAPAKRMIVLVPANTTRQAVMDVLKKYLVLLPLAGFVALLIELAMGFGGLFSSVNKAAERYGDSAPMLTSQGGNLNASLGAGDTNILIANGPGMPPAPEAFSNLTGAAGGWLKSPAAGNISDAVSNNATYALNRTAETALDVGAALPQEPATSAAAAGTSMLTGLFSHYGLWFFIGCALIIGILMTYEVYRVRKGKGKKK
ncbi:MAG: Helix-turn-helix domain protein [Methanocella sp. PtaU1.Bin125]|nr:MAG: Helix-turn-helix domain protein [Methanocella sp. PtaU1.Bin125]